MSIVTKKGDQGETALMYSRRISKSHPRVESYGAVDALNTALGLARASALLPLHKERLLTIQKQLVTVMGELATAAEDTERYTRDGYPRLDHSQTAVLEDWVKEIEGAGLRFEGWAMPGENMPSAALEFARTSCRLAERRVCALMEIEQSVNPHLVVYLNRLSDLLWLMARDAERSPAA